MANKAAELNQLVRERYTDVEMARTFIRKLKI